MSVYKIQGNISALNFITNCNDSEPHLDSAYAASLLPSHNTVSNEMKSHTAPFFYSPPATVSAYNLYLESASMPSDNLSPNLFFLICILHFYHNSCFRIARFNHNIAESFSRFSIGRYTPFIFIAQDSKQNSMIEIFFQRFPHKGIAYADRLLQIQIQKGFPPLLLFPSKECLAELFCHFPVFFHFLLKQCKNPFCYDISYFPVWNCKAIAAIAFSSALCQVSSHEKVYSTDDPWSNTGHCR